MLGSGWSNPLIFSLSTTGGGEGRGEAGDSRALVGTHLTLPSLRDGPSLSPERRGSSANGAETRDCTRMSPASTARKDYLCYLGKMVAVIGLEPMAFWL